MRTLVAGLLLGSGSLFAQSSAGISIGGPFSCSSEGFDNPARLADGITEASALLIFTLDNAEAELTVSVTNTSPVLAGVPNPVISQVYFNAPSAITGMSLLAQDGSGGALASFALSFDANPSGDANKAGLFGNFEVQLDNPGGIQGAIANASADTLPGPDGSLVSGPVAFVFSLQGDLGGLEAADFANGLSSGSKPTEATCHFQGGGAADASAKISAATGPCSAAAESIPLGIGFGATLAMTPPIQGGPVSIFVDGNTPFAIGAIFQSSPLDQPFQAFGAEIWLNVDLYAQVIFMTDASGDFEYHAVLPSNVDRCGLQRNLQAIVLSPNGPTAFGEITNGILAQVGI